MSKKKYFDAKRALVFMLGALVIETTREKFVYDHNPLY
jgi:hypothetical protein